MVPGLGRIHLETGQQADGELPWTSLACELSGHGSTASPGAGEMEQAGKR